MARCGLLSGGAAASVVSVQPPGASNTFRSCTSLSTRAAARKSAGLLHDRVTPDLACL